MKKTTVAVASTLLLGLAANNAHAFDPQMRGSDTLGPIMDYMIGTAASPASGFGFYAAGSMIEYSYEGSGNGETEIQVGNQELGPMSRFLKTSGGAGCAHASAVPRFAGCWQIARDAITMFGSPTTAAIGPGEEDGCVLRYSENMPVGDGNLNGSTVCPGCVGGNYPFADWRSVLRVLYAGEEVDSAVAQTALSATRDCNSDVRNTLVNTWGNLFNGTCGDGNCATGLKHAFRRDDVSGTTVVLLEFLNLPPIATNPFCNGNETDDKDPIRRACAGNGAVTIPGNTGGETVCGVGLTPSVRNADGTLGTKNLGLVLPILLPPVPAGAPATFSKYGGDTTLAAKNCSAIASGGSGGGAFGRVKWTGADVAKFGPKCPNGEAVVFGTCNWPKAPGSPPGDEGSTPVGFGCTANVNSRPTGTPTTFDARVYNLWARNSDGTIKKYNRGTNTPAQNASFYRYRQHNCRLEDETGSQACLITADTCTIGFGGRSGVEVQNAAALGMRELVNVATSYPTYQDSVVTPVYPLARPLYLCEIRPTPADAFPGDPKHHTTAGGNVSDAFVAAQATIRADLVNDVHTRIAPLLDAVNHTTSGGFFAVPSFSKKCCVGNYDDASDSCI